MKRLYVACAAGAMLLIWGPALLAADLVVAPVVNLRHGTPVDIHRPQACTQCGREMCVTRTPVQKCVPGKKLVYDTCKRYEYVTVAETKYRFHKRLVMKKVPADYCKTVCKDNDHNHCHSVEKWDAAGGTCSCGQVHCKNCVPDSENIPCKTCSTEPGKTTTTVRYWTCVKEPYTVYRQVRREICVKKPRYEHVTVPITKYVCDSCNSCGDPGCDSCDGAGCDSCSGQ